MQALEELLNIGHSFSSSIFLPTKYISYGRTLLIVLRHLK
uniref:Uncharacterized protein n=1 Tax=Podoviridae sp. ctzXp5 TaxID=2827758 RepID=A0A8S5TES5_9CAUD|nr:MAG TPA: hypothetical protein [Podoviridae sp. ctzXp5]